MNAVRASENIEKTACRIAIQVNPFVRQSSPCQDLPDQENEPECGGHQPEILEAPNIGMTQSLACHLKGSAAYHKRHSVEPQKCGDMHGHPACPSFANKKRARQRHEKHQHGNDANSHSRVIPG